ncbi:nitroreductase family protein [Paenibacillus radicis (ex Gao et al. 2016)]|uniref:NAD(P)H nitroreductase MhqN n=1 Tax=Paenibacillus radicis (ex Gao et al. 2016) TaxID=1737354 RepID=A0A917HBM9_9BACL|nr:nitroreductase family protein [Paenibacillus radicis (ex Gao et al. 2016)]GGG72817.1 putative NAD(P)H nitroreductase MhqN [Paenibacillus radicis (ex Gao et al. 2016)]
MSELTTVVKERRSAMKFKPEVEISEQELNEMFGLVKYAPSAFNLQHARYVVVRDEAVKAQLHEAAGKQYKVLTASAVIMVLGNQDAYQDVGPIHEGLLNLGVMSKQEYDATVESVVGFYEERGETFKRDEAIRNASLSAMQFMLIAKDKGWDTCPMIGFDANAVSGLLNIPENHVPVMMITIGKEDTSSQRPRGYRKPVGEFVSYDTF